MSTKMIIFLFAIVLILALIAGGLRRGSRVTQVDRTMRKEKDDDDA